MSHRTRWSITGTCLLLLSACGGGGGGGTAGPGGTGPATLNLPAGKILVDGHIINPSFVTPGRDYYVNVSYFDASGTLMSYHEVFEWSGTEPTYAYDYRYTYDASGTLQREEIEDTYTREGKQFFIHSFTERTLAYDAQGHVTSETTTWVRSDQNGDGAYDDEVAGSVQKRVTHTYDAQGRLRRTELDWDGDGLNTQSDKATTYTYDASGNPVREEVDNGDWVEVRINTFDAADRKETQTVYATADHFARGERRSVTTYVYDAAGRVEREELDNGVANTSDRVLDGIADRVIRYAFGAAGEVVRKTTELIRPSQTERDVVRYLHETTDADGDGTPEVSTVYVTWSDTEYDSGGGYPPEALPAWYTAAQSNLNNGDANDGWGLNWEGHSTGTCSTCGNMLGQVNTILMGF